MTNHPRRSRLQATTGLSSVTQTVDLTKPRKRPVPPLHSTSEEWDALLRAVQTALMMSVGENTNHKLFRTDAIGLYDAYLNAMPSDRQMHTCHECRRFIESYGGLVAVDAYGKTEPAFWFGTWNVGPKFYTKPLAAMHALVSKARVTGPFVPEKAILGVPHTPGWTHLHAQLPAAMVHRDRAVTSAQAEAAKIEDFRTVSRALSEFSIEQIGEALRVLHADAVNRAEKFIAPLEWLRDRRVERIEVRNARERENLLWRAVASAPPGYCHPRTSMTGSLIEDIAAGLPFEAVRAKFNTKMHPLAYQRPQAAPKAGAIVAAEALVERLGLARSLERRYARLDEVECLWKPAPPKPERTGGVFGHLKTKGEAERALNLHMPSTTMTWEKFTRTVLPVAERIEFLVPRGAANYISLTTAAHADAPPIIRWDREEQRNPMSWFVRVGGITPSEIGMVAGQWTPVSGIAMLPNHWHGNPQPQHGIGAILLLANAKGIPAAANCLFPEHLRDDLHGIRSTVEAYSKTSSLGPRDDVATGYDLRKDSRWDCRVRVWSSSAAIEYQLDRWD